MTARRTTNMTTQVMQQALEALELSRGDAYFMRSTHDAIQAAETALREAIAANEIAALKAAQPVEEMATPYITQEQIERAFPDTPTPPAKPPEALRLASWLCEGAWHRITLGDVESAGRELRRLHALTTTKPAPAAPYQVPNGWQLVPVEPNHQMLEYFDRVRFRPMGVSSESAAKSMYAEMLAAARKAAA